MKQKKLLKKVQRYIELSTEFQTPEKDLFDVDPIFASEPISSTGIIMSSNSASNYYYVSSYVEAKSRSEVILSNAKEKMNEAQLEAQRADRFDEYIELRNELSGICEALLKI